MKASSRWRGTRGELSVQLIDVSRAHFYADAVRDVFVRLPPEDPRSHEHGLCGKLCKTMYGSLDASEQWSIHYGAVLENAGFKKGLACACHFYHAGRDLSLVVHGDDFTFCGIEEELLWIKSKMESWFEIKFRGILGLDPGNCSSVVILGRVVSIDQ